MGLSPAGPQDKTRKVVYIQNEKLDIPLEVGESVDPFRCIRELTQEAIVYLCF